MIDSGGGGGGEIPNGTTKMAQNDSEQPILPNSTFSIFSHRSGPE